MSMLMMLPTSPVGGRVEDEGIDQTGDPFIFADPGFYAPAPFNNNVAGLNLADTVPYTPYLPDPAIYSRPAPGMINGANFGPVGTYRDSHYTPVNAPMGWLPPISQNSQAAIGNSNLAARQYAGVLNQLSAYNNSQLESAANLVGIQLGPTVNRMS